MIYNIILAVLFAVQTIILLIITIVRNREINKEIKKSDDLVKKSDDLIASFDFFGLYRLMWGEWFQKNVNELIENENNKENIK